MSRPAHPALAEHCRRAEERAWFHLGVHEAPEKERVGAALAATFLAFEHLTFVLPAVPREA